MITQVYGRARRRAFTICEVVVAMTILLLVLAGVLTAHLFGARLFSLTKVKLGASQEARQAISLMMNEIRTGKLVKIGSGSIDRFTEVPPDTAQNGSAIQIYPTTDTNQFIRYFWDARTKALKRTVDGTSAVSIVATSITNELVFRAEDFRGNVLRNNENNRVISLDLQFYQIQYPVALIGPGQLFDYYQLRTKITRRALE